MPKPPLVGIAGAAVDYGRSTGARVEAQRLVDAAALAAAQRMSDPNVTQDEIRADLQSRIMERLPRMVDFAQVSIIFMQEWRGARIEMDYVLPTTLTRMLGKETMSGSIFAEAMAAVDSAEIAVALDVTGSMRSHVPAVREATRDLID
ncbi:pilus assembly protein TadG-related protein [Saliniramus sp.]|uniref:pilus assembly protein TadG-related protein n=1 Tax=Saliniramus sp. TaxID=2986772 RepID=UPI002BD2AEAF|nr:pilus assembly protein TadG-related protein [Saliniramus sp.]HMB10335.1 pilus assembly protein TadG-related protein [Saliniramus sp.]